MSKENNMTPKDYAEKCCDTIINKFPEAELPPTGKFHYHAGVFLSGMERTYVITKKEKYNEYIHKWLDWYIDGNGNISNADTDTLDDIEPCNLLIRYYKSGEEQYKKVLDEMVPMFLDWKCNKSGGFWHKMCYPNQMWLDGIYMAGPLSVQYGIITGKNEYIDIIQKQFRLMWKYTRSEETGLLYHAWDESKEAEWANKENGKSPEFWGRAIGWYLVAAADMSEMLSGEASKEFADCAVELAKAVIKYQDEKTGMWYQVVDKGEMKDNWLETSCSCLFLYGISNLIRRGLLGEEYKAAAIKAYNGIIENKTYMDGDKLIVKDICIGTGVGDYTHYIERPRTENDLHGTGAFTLMCTEYYKMLNKQ